MQLAVSYTIFAMLATAANIGSQDLAIRLYDGPYGVTLSILVGTAVGLMVKYGLDKRYIFRFRARDFGHDTRTFIAYTGMGVFTTIIFWGFEYGFDALFGTKALRYLGGILGLAIGYWLKYHLDRRFVFATGSA